MLMKNVKILLAFFSKETNLVLVLLCQLTKSWRTWIPAFAGMTEQTGLTSRVIPAKAGIHTARCDGNMTK